MECCGQEVKATALELAGSTCVLYRCSDCNRRTWVRQGRVVSFADVSAAMTHDAAVRRKGRAAA